jgi:hypothetical protein
VAKKARRLTAAEQKHLEERARVATQLAWQLVTESVKRRPGAAAGFPHAEYRKRLAAAFRQRGWKPDADDPLPEAPPRRPAATEHLYLVVPINRHWNRDDFMAEFAFVADVISRGGAVLTLKGHPFSRVSEFIWAPVRPRPARASKLRRPGAGGPRRKLADQDVLDDLKRAPGRSAQARAERFNVSLRTMRRAIDRLRLAGKLRGSTHGKLRVP